MAMAVVEEPTIAVHARIGAFLEDDGRCANGSAWVQFGAGVL